MLPTPSNSVCQLPRINSRSAFLCCDRWERLSTASLVWEAFTRYLALRNIYLCSVVCHFVTKYIMLASQLPRSRGIVGHACSSLLQQASIGVASQRDVMLAALKHDLMETSNATGLVAHVWFTHVREQRPWKIASAVRPRCATRRNPPSNKGITSY